MPQSAVEGGWWGTVLGTITSLRSLEWRVGLWGTSPAGGAPTVTQAELCDW